MNNKKQTIKNQSFKLIKKEIKKILENQEIEDKTIDKIIRDICMWVDIVLDREVNQE